MYNMCIYIDTVCSFFTLQTWSNNKKLHLVCLHLFRSETEGLASLGSGKRWAPRTPMVIVEISPKDRVVGDPFHPWPNFMAHKWGWCYQLSTSTGSPFFSGPERACWHGPNCGGARPLELRSSNYHYQHKTIRYYFREIPSTLPYMYILSWFDPPKKMGGPTEWSLLKSSNPKKMKKKNNHNFVHLVSLPGFKTLA